MIKISYEGKAYYYENAGQQPWDINTEIVLNDDISRDYAILAFLKMLTIAGYRLDNREDLERLFENVAELYEYEGL